VTQRVLLPGASQSPPTRLGLESLAIGEATLEAASLRQAQPGEDNRCGHDGRPVPGALGLEVLGQAESGEEVGVEEVVMPDDLAVRNFDDLEGEGIVATSPVRVVRSERSAAVGRGGKQA